MSNSNEQGIYINGRQQIIEMLQFMNQNERKKLLDNIRMRNAVMARELSEQSLSFYDLEKLPETLIGKIFSRTNAAIIGLSLYNAKTSFQKKVLSSLERETAIEAFQIMNQNLSQKQNECKRAQEKIIQLAIALSRSQQIQI